MTVDIGTTTSVIFATTFFTAQLISVSYGGITRNALETSKMGTAAPGVGDFSNKTFIPGDLSNPGELTLEIHFNPDLEPPIDQPAELMFITWPVPFGKSLGALWFGTGFFTSYEPGAVLEEVMAATMVFKMTGNVILIPAS